MFKYSISLQWSDEDGGYIATIQELPGISAFGETAEEAACEIKDAAELCIEALKEEGKTIPQPKVIERYSGQFRIRIPKTLHQELSKRAEFEGVSLNLLVNNILAKGIAEESVIEEVDKREVQYLPKTSVEITTITNDYDERFSGEGVKHNTKSEDNKIVPLFRRSGGAKC